MSNFPPGVTVNMIPGNRPEDEAWERWVESLDIDDIADNLLSRKMVQCDNKLYKDLHTAVVSVLEDADQESVGNLGASLGCNSDFELWMSGRGDYERGRFTDE